MEPIGIDTQQQGKGIPVREAVILLFFLILLELGGASLYRLYIGKDRLHPLLFIAGQRVIGLIMLLGLLFTRGYDLGHLGLAARGLKKGLLHGIIWCFGFGLLVLLIGSILWWGFSINPLYLFGRIDFQSVFDLVITLLVGCMLGPVVEDMVFIGILFTSMRGRMNLIASILITATLFALAHGFISAFLIIQFIGGLLFTLSFAFSGSLLTPMIIHICGNMAILAIQML